MCEPTVIATATTAAVGAGVSLYRSRQQAEVAQNNADLARQQAGMALQRGELAASAIEAQGRRQTSSALAQLAASGVETTTGSPAALLAQSEANAAADAEQARANASMGLGG